MGKMFDMVGGTQKHNALDRNDFERKIVGESTFWDDITANRSVDNIAVDGAGSAKRSSQNQSFYCPYCGGYISKYVPNCPECHSILPSLETMMERYRNQASSRSSVSKQDENKKETAYDNSSLAKCLVADWQISVASPALKEYESMSRLFNELGGNLERAGIALSASELRILLSSIASSRILIYDSSYSDEMKELLNATNEFMCGLPTQSISITADCTSKEILGSWVGKKTNSTVNLVYFDDSDFLQSMYKAVSVQAPMIQIVENNDEVNGCDFVKMMHAYADAPEMKKIMGNPELKGIYSLPKQWSSFSDGVYIPKNTWFALSNASLVDDAQQEEFILYPELHITPGAAKRSTEKAEAHYKISIDDFEKLCRDARASFYFQESTFRKLESLEEYMKKSITAFKFDNCFLRRLECFSSVYMAIGGTENEALDAAMHTFILPAALALGIDASDLKDAITRIFGDKILPVSLKLLSAIV